MEQRAARSSSSLRQLVVLVDGECVLCSNYVRFVAAYDVAGRLAFETQARQHTLRCAAPSPPSQQRRNSPPPRPSRERAAAPQQSDVGKQLLREAGLPADLSTIVVLERSGDRIAAATTQSTAVLRSVSVLAWPARALYAFILVPRPFRDALYRFGARRRTLAVERGTAASLANPEGRTRGEAWRSARSQSRGTGTRCSESACRARCRRRRCASGWCATGARRRRLDGVRMV